MGIGGSILLIVIGAIFTFALDVNLGWLDLDVVGWVLMLAGVVGLILTMWFWQSRRRTVVRPAPPPAYTDRSVDPAAPAAPAVPVRDDRVEEYREVRRDRY